MYGVQQGAAAIAADKIKCLCFFAFSPPPPPPQKFFKGRREETQQGLGGRGKPTGASLNKAHLLTTTQLQCPSQISRLSFPAREGVIHLSLPRIMRFKMGGTKKFPCPSSFRSPIEKGKSFGRRPFVSPSFGGGEEANSCE